MNVKRKFILFLALFPVLNCFCQTIAEYNKYAAEKINKHDYKGAIEEYTKIIKLNPADSSAYFDRGIAKEYLKDYKGAIADYTKAIAVDSTNPDNYYLRGLAKDKLKNYTGAIADFSKALALEPANADIYYYRGLAKATLKDFKNAIADFTEAIKSNSDRAAEVYAKRGWAKAQTQEYREAIEDYNKAISIDPFKSEYFLQRGNLKILAGQKESGNSDLDIYLKMGGKPGK